MQRPAETAGFITDHFGKKQVVAANDVEDPSPLEAGTKTMFGGRFTYTSVLNVVLHVVTATVTIIAATGHLVDSGDTHLTPTHDDDYVRGWCVLMIAAQVLGIAIFVAVYGCFVQGFRYPLIAILGGFFFFASFVCTLKLTYFMEIGGMKVNGTNANSEMNKDSTGWAATALYLQCAQLASILFTGQSGLFAKVIALS